MEGREDRLLGAVIANHLFLAQFELFRASVLTLSARSPALARDVYQTVIRKIWTLRGVVWSASVPSAAHMAWLCLQELHAMEEKLMDGGGVRGKAHEEGVQSEDDPWEAAAAAGGKEPGFKENQWQFYCRPVYDCIEFLLLLEFVKQCVVVEDGRSGAGDVAVSEEEGASSGGAEKVDNDRSVLDERLGLHLIGKIASVGLERLDRSIKFVTGHGSEGGDRDDRGNEDEGVGRAETSGSTGSDEAVEESFSEVDKKWLRHLTLGQPELLDALCQNIARQQHGGSNLHMDSQREVDPERVDDEPQEDSSRPDGAVLGSLERFELGSAIQREVQEAHLNQIMEDVKETQLLKAINHLRFLHEDFGIAESDCSGAIYSILKEAKSLAREQHDSVLQAIYECSLTSGSTLLPKLIESVQDDMLRGELDQSKASLQALYPPPLEQLHQRLLQLRLGSSSGSGSFSMTETSATRTCLRELYQYARVDGAHVLELAVKAALASVKDRQLQKVADLMTPFPRLQPLVAAMGWDLLAGHTKSRRKLMELLWNNKAKLTGFSHGRATDEVSCVEQLCDQLCYRLELAYFAARSIKGVEGQSVSTRIFVKGNRPKAENIEGPADPFVANLVLERLTLHSPVRVLFDLVPDIKRTEALELVKLQPTGTSAEAYRQRHLDLELLHMHYGLQAIVLALSSMEVSAENKSSIDKESNSTAIYLQQLREHLDAITSPVRRVWIMGIIVSLLHMDEISVQLPTTKDPFIFEPKDTNTEKGEKFTAIAFIQSILKILHQCMPGPSLELDSRGPSASRSGLSRKASTQSFSFPGRAAKKAWLKRLELLHQFVDDWNWRIGVLQRLSPSSQRPWQWREALAVLRAAPSTILYMCVQRNQYDLGQEAVHRFKLSPEEAASLQLAQWVDSAASSDSVDDTTSRVAKELSDDNLDFTTLQAPLAPLAAVLLCVDVAATSVRSVDMARRLLDRARGLLSQIQQTGQRGQGPEQRQEACMTIVAKRTVTRLNELLDQDKIGAPQLVLSGADMVSITGTDSSRQVFRQRALAILQQTIEDAFRGKRQFLSGKLHNLVKALADEEGEDSSTGPHAEKKSLLGPEHSLGLGLGLRPPRQGSRSSASSGGSGSTDFSGDNTFQVAAKGAMKRFLGPLSNKPMAYLSAFILYIATVGDIVDGVDTTHDFNFFTLIYERPNDLLTRLVFERGSADAAGKVAEIMGADLVHQVISACVPPVYPPRGGKGWACIPQLPTRVVQPATQRGDVHVVQTTAHDDDEPQLYPLQLDVVKHLATLSPVRAVLACVFGQSFFTRRASDPGLATSSDIVDADRSFFDFALEQSEKYPTLNRWIQLQAKLQSLADVSTSSHNLSERKADGRTSLKRPREPEVEDIHLPPDSDQGDEVPETSQWNMKSSAQNGQDVDSSISGETMTGQRTRSYSLMFDWENEAPYSEAVMRLMEEGKLVEALSVSDRWLRDGAPDQLLQLLIEKGEETGSEPGNQWQGNNSSHPYSSSWQYCIRLRNKTLAATLALKYLQRWDLDAAIDVLTMCSCHLSPDDSLYLEVVKKRDTLQQYGRIQRADNRFTQWQEVEALCQSDPEGLALRLAGKGAVSAALDVAESFKLSSDLRRELQGRQLVKLLTTDPISGGGPAGGLRFLNSLHHPEDALPVAMQAMELLPNLQSKQLLVHFFLKRRVGSLSEEEHARLDRLALGLRMLGALPLPWQQRCSALHEHPRLILETLLMGKQLRAASQLLQAFPSLKDDELVKIYAAKALAVSSTPLERRTSTSTVTPAVKPITRTITPTARSNFNSGLNTLQRRAFSWTTRDTGNKIINPDNSSRKRKIAGVLPPSHKAAWEALAGVPEERTPAGLTALEGYERPAPMTITEEWVLTGDPTKDGGVRNSHRYESAPSSILFKALLELCSSEAVACKAAVDICITQIKRYLSSEQLPRATFGESAERGFHAADAFVQALQHARDQLKKLTEKSEKLPSSPKAGDTNSSEALDSASAATTSAASPGSKTDGAKEAINLLDVLEEAEIWLNRVELLQTLFGNYVPASLDDIVDDSAAEQLRDRLIAEERYNLAVFMCTKCKVEPFPVWDAWGHALLRIEHYAQARVKFKKCLQLYSGDPAIVVRKIILAMEAGPPADVFGARSLYAHMARSVSTSSDDSLSADSYLNVLYVPSFNKPDRSRRSSEESADSHQTVNTQINGDESPPHSYLDETRYEECVYYLQEHARQDLMQFMFQHCRYTEACNLFFPYDSLPSAPLPSSYQSQAPSSSPQKPDPLATDYGTLDELCDLCVAFGVVPTLERVIAARSADANNPDSPVSQHTASALTRICTYFENHRHFNHLYRFQVLKKDYVAAGLCCIQLFLNSSNQEQALRHLEHAKVHFDEGLLARQQSGETTKGVTKASRGKLPSQKLTEDELIKFTSRVAIQIEVVRAFGDSEGPPWKHSLFGNPNDADTVKRRCDVAEKLVEKNFDLAFQIINEFFLTAVHIYAGVAAYLAERKKSNQLAELLRNIKGTIDDDDWDQVLGAAINVYANRHRERPTGLIDKLSSNHRKVLACVICGRLKSAFQIASRSENISDVQYVAHVARQTGSLAVEDLCKQWLASHSL
ncbi:hypothetical protein M758_11G022200 [Ceratodon purpureus]|nr:hypothetical protein M758_11G022200 [Ceratodon purpureus]